MGKASGLLKIAVKNSIAYKFEFIMTLIVAPLSMIVTYFLWKAIFGFSQTATIGGFSFNQLITYYVFGWVIGIITWTDVPDYLSYIIRKGMISKDLTKPINLILFFFYNDIGSRLFALLVEILPLMIISIIFFKIQIIPATLPGFAAATAVAFVLNFLMATLVGMTAFWLTHNRGVLKLKNTLVHFISGAVLPLTFFPLWFQKLSFFMPFQYMEFVPINFWLGKFTLAQNFILILMGIGWVIIFYLLCMLVWNRAIKKVTAVGI